MKIKQDLADHWQKLLLTKNQFIQVVLLSAEQDISIDEWILKAADSAVKSGFEGHELPRATPLHKEPMVDCTLNIGWDRFGEIRNLAFPHGYPVRDWMREAIALELSEI